MTSQAAEQERDDVVAARHAWRAEQSTLPANRLVFVDETSATTAMARRYGRSRRGTRCVGHIPQAHWHTTTFVGALRAEALIAPLVLDGAINGTTFRAWVEQFLVPELKPGDVVVMDNLGSHKVAGVSDAIAAAGAQVRYLPPYSPDLNPIEQVFAKLKALLRKTATRTKEALWTAIGRLLDQFHPAECRRYLQHSGYTHPG